MVTMMTSKIDETNDGDIDCDDDIGNSNDGSEGRYIDDDNIAGGEGNDGSEGRNNGDDSSIGVDGSDDHNHNGSDGCDDSDDVIAVTITTAVIAVT